MEACSSGCVFIMYVQSLGDRGSNSQELVDNGYPEGSLQGIAASTPWHLHGRPGPYITLLCCMKPLPEFSENLCNLF